ncbi:hypothetical protein J6Z19_06995 [bacterium]|nr:hypothetical protein [bacterium]
MKKIIFIITALFFLGCSGSGNDKVELEISYLLDNGRTCKTYLADHFLVTVYDSEQRKMMEKQIACSENEDNNNAMTLSVEKDSYYISVVLRDAGKMWQSYGAAKTDVLKDTKVEINMQQYTGGMIFKWNSDNCKKQNVSVMAFTLISEENPVNATIWGEDAEMKKFQVPCAAGRFEVINIDYEPTYSATVNALRIPASKQSRISYEISEFVSGHGQNKELDMEDSDFFDKKILVSDMVVSWEFDSQTIITSDDACKTAGITKVEALLKGKNNEAGKTQDCDNGFSDIRIYDITEDEYTLYLYGKSDDGEILFESSLDVGLIEPGSFGKNALKNKIFLKEK